MGMGLSERQLQLPASPALLPRPRLEIPNLIAAAGRGSNLLSFETRGAYNRDIDVESEPGCSFLSVAWSWSHVGDTLRSAISHF